MSGCRGYPYKVSRGTDKTWHGIEFVLLYMWILIERNVVRWICRRKLVSTLAVRSEGISMNRGLLQLGPMPFWWILLGHWLKILARSLRSLDLIALEHPQIASSTSGFGTYRHKNLVSRAEAVFKYLRFGFTHLNAESTLAVTLRAFSTGRTRYSSCRLIGTFIYIMILGFRCRMMMWYDRLDK